MNPKAALHPGNYAAKLHAYALEHGATNEDVGALTGLLFDAQVEPKPHQIDAALFALHSPFLKGVILADEVGLGKTIEAGIVISQLWAERKRRILIIAPASLRQQWSQELAEKFLIPSLLLERNNLEQALLTDTSQVLICSYEFARIQRAHLARGWDAVICDEAHRLRSHWTGKAKIPQAVAGICQTAAKSIMLTATPLQNRLEELYGLVTIFDPHYFHSLEAFRERYINDADGVGNDDLAGRVSGISQRTLRKDADKYIRFTQRLPLTLAFTPSPDEQRLYELVNSYLQRPNLHAFSSSQRQLSALIIRKRLGSSSFALAATLENIANRLLDEHTAGKRRNNAGMFIDDPDIVSDIAEESHNLPEEPQHNPQRSGTVDDEIAELQEYAALARRITTNQKALKLLDALEQGFAKLREIGAPEKALIFTDSTITQNYLVDVLNEHGWGEGIVTFNGTNTSKESTAIYERWLERNQHTGLITGVPTADRRKALVDEFRENGRIMIATEAAAEGINLQFCSMLINYDLPWNPQRVEQRIGRIHRFGQQHNVVVVNFSNKGNVAEERILELLSEKFHLFSSVFGASDEVLGQIEDGLAFEKNIVAILEQCTSSEEINRAFDELEAQYATQISHEMNRTRAKVFANLDPKVRDKLKSYEQHTLDALNAFERLLFTVTQHELRNHAHFDLAHGYFTVHTPPQTDITPGMYYLKSSPRESAQQYRYASPLAQWVMAQAKDNPTPDAHLTFTLHDSQRVTAQARALAGKTGTVRLEHLKLSNPECPELTREQLVMVGTLHDGTPMDAEQIADLFDLTCTEATPRTHDSELLLRQANTHAERFLEETQTRNSEYLYQQEELIEARRRDLKSTFDAQARELASKAKSAEKLARQATNQMERLKLTREARRFERLAEDAYDDYRQARDKLRDQSDEYLAQIEAALTLSPTRIPLFTATWIVQ